jgi:hypothetical protein
MIRLPRKQFPSFVGEDGGDSADFKMFGKSNWGRLDRAELDVLKQ